MVPRPFSRGGLFRYDRTEARISSVERGSVLQVHTSVDICFSYLSGSLEDDNGGRGGRASTKSLIRGVEFCAVRPTRAPRASLDSVGPDFRESDTAEVLRISLLGTSVNTPKMAYSRDTCDFGSGVWWLRCVRSG